MGNYIEKNDKIAFHPGYYLKEYIDELNIALCDFSKLIDINLLELTNIINGEQKLNLENATKIAKYLGTSIEYWMNLQREYDCILNKD